MTIARLSDPATYTAFDPEERMRMTRYRNRVDELQGFRFFASGNKTVRMFSNRDRLRAPVRAISTERVSSRGNAVSHPL